MPDVPASPQRKQVSSVSANARSQTQKKPGAPKPKGAVRAKSGCYTCRIRRKKCDEQPNAEGSCQTCVRLRLQCLGFGAKRPDWMRENNSVLELREKIKNFLASQGMIKGHSGSGPRSTEGEPPILVLVENLHSSPSSPPTPTLSATSSDGHPRPSVTSYVREPHYHHPPPMHPQTESAQQYAAPPPPRLHNGSASSASYTHSSATSSTSAISYLGAPPTLESSFSPLYHYHYNAEEESSQTPSPPEGIVTLPMMNYDTSFYQNQRSWLIQHYVSSVLPIQYLLADSSIRNVVYSFVRDSPAVRDAACLLSALHMRMQNTRGNTPLEGVDAMYKKIEQSLVRRTQGRIITGDDAMASLHVVSTFLFSGGRGSWDTYLNIARGYVRTLLDSPNHLGPVDVLQKCTESERFIIKTTMWFDVLASVTTQQIPTFMNHYRSLFGRSSAYITDEQGVSRELSMMEYMGCENHIVLAIAEISALANWKKGQLRLHALSIPELVARGQEIENEFLSPSSPFNQPRPLSNGFDGLNGHHSSYPPAEAEITERRRLTNSIFHASAKVYLHTVLSGDYPACPEIAQGVAETIECLRRVPFNSPTLHRGVIRSVVFGICISGCLTDNPEHRDFLLKLLATQQNESVGNVSAVKALMQQVWALRQRNSGQPVNWREVMQESRRDMLLLV
ncbi:fungal-specific transcription factor domain-containing protein [Abortiporus biennis]|nr:fungal-specific transcription factor domain-containing protein [Abortiporus biennis]